MIGLGILFLQCVVKLHVMKFDQARHDRVFPDIANADDNPMSRRKSLKKSLRESFRRLRKGRSQRNVDKNKKATPTQDPIKKEM